MTEQLVVIPAGMDCSIKGQKSPYRKRPPKPNGSGGIKFHAWRKHA